MMKDKLPPGQVKKPKGGKPLGKGKLGGKKKGY